MAIIIVLALPPNESSSSQVNLLQLQSWGQLGTKRRKRGVMEDNVYRSTARHRSVGRCGHIRITVRNVSCSFASDELRDDVAEGGQRQVDLRCFFEALPLGVSLRLPLAASEVYEVKFPNTDMVFSVGTNLRALD